MRYHVINPLWRDQTTPAKNAAKSSRNKRRKKRRSAGSSITLPGLPQTTPRRPQRPTSNLRSRPRASRQSSCRAVWRQWLDGFKTAEVCRAECGRWIFRQATGGKHVEPTSITDRRCERRRDGAFIRQIRNARFSQRSEHVSRRSQTNIATAPSKAGSKSLIGMPSALRSRRDGRSGTAAPSRNLPAVAGNASPLLRLIVDSVRELIES